MKLILALFFIVCQKQPEYPPSKAQALIREGNAASDNSVVETVKSFKRLLKQKSYLTLLAVFGVTLGVFNSFCTFLNQVILVYFPVRHHLQRNRVFAIKNVPI